MTEPQHRHRLFAPMTAGARHAVIFLFTLTLVLAGLNLLWTSRQVGSATATRASLYQLCETGNEFRAQQVTLWLHIIAVSAPPPHQTPAQARQREAAIRAFAAYVRHVFAPRNCAASVRP